VFVGEVMGAVCFVLCCCNQGWLNCLLRWKSGKYSRIHHSGCFVTKGGLQVD